MDWPLINVSLYSLRYAIANDTSTSANIDLTAFIHSHADADTYVHVTGEVDVTCNAAAVYTARAFRVHVKSR